jgi:hypothetical protein
MILDFLNDVRRNHALEHATVSLLISRLGPELRLVGRATGNGFFIYGAVPSDVLSECAHEGLTRLKRGEAFWAVTPLCGTNIATAGILASLSTMAVLGSGHRRDRAGSALIAGMVAVTAAQPIGRLIQKHLTTSPDVHDLEIVAVESRSAWQQKVRTQRIGAAIGVATASL